MIVVTGATGRFGRAVVRTLRDLDLPVRAMVRKGSAYYWLNDTGCGYFFGDLRDPQSLRRALDGAQYLVVCSGIGRESKDSNHKDITIAGHQALFEAAKGLEVERVVLVSCMGADADADVPAFVARKAAEEALIETGLDHVILRTCLHEYAFLELAWRIHDKGPLSLPGPGDNALSVLPTTDLARMAAASLDLDSVRNQVVDVGGAASPTFREALHLACNVIGTRPEIRTMPSTVVNLATRIRKPFRRYANELAEHRHWCCTTLTVDAQQITSTFGFPLSDLETSMAKTNEFLFDLRDPERSAARMVHPQFYATVYEPGTADLADLPDGPTKKAT